MKVIEFKKRLREPLRQATLCFLLRDDEVLLAMKKRGFGEGRWNGVGGKLNPGEEIERAAIRETKEEIGVTPEDLEGRSVLDFYFLHHLDWCLKVTVYLARNWKGTPRETDEMRPKWYKINDLPFVTMWPDDKYWLPQVLAGEQIRGSFLFGKNDKILDYHVGRRRDI